MKEYYKNEYLFSEIYLEEITQLDEDRSLLATFQTFTENRLYADRANLKLWNESFVHELLRTLKFRIENVNDNLSLLKQYGEDDNPLSVCYSLLPDEDLDNSLMGSNYAYEIIAALKKNDLNWGILTNGNKWRIYHTDEPTPYENYLGIDLKAIIDDQAKQAFQLIFFFLKAENFTKDEDGNCEFDFFKEESQNKIEYIEAELKNALKQREEGGQDILSNICFGYVQYLRDNGRNDFADEDLRDEIYGGALLYMFRLLFLFYAKARGLMDKTDSLRFQIIVDSAKEKYIGGNTDALRKELWVNLRDIFGEIDNTYNGGLFNRDENQYTKFIEDAWISDNLLAAVIYNMSHYEEHDGQVKLISYRDMNVRHLGTLYEGLLEHKLFIAEEDIEIQVTKKEIKFISESEGGKIIEGQYIPLGQVYFGNDKGLRKATGSYYTPEYIVEYIVNNTVDEKLKELKEKFDKQIEPLIQDLDVAITEAERKNISALINDQLLAFTENEILELSVLDPAMGSGHFLVNATSHIANFITDFLNSYDIKSEAETNSNYWSRQVVENCIYGVDLNILATELAKLSLWILTMAKDKPLSFLNHHLKIGNSLIGAKLEDLGTYPYSDNEPAQKDLFTQDEDFNFTVKQVIKDYNRIKSEGSDNRQNIETKKEFLDEIDRLLKPYKDLCDLHTSIYFGNEIEEEDYAQIITKKLVPKEKYYDEYFHWELEFPKILVEDQGFNCIIGNPPYVSISKLGFFTNVLEEFNYLTFRRNGDLYCLFIEKGADLLKEKGVLSFITSNTWMKTNYGIETRKFLLEYTNPIRLINFSDIQVFKGATIETNILTIEKYPFDNSIIGCEIKSDFNEKIGIEKYIYSNKLNLNSLGSDPWFIASSQVYDLKRKIEYSGTKIKEWDLKFYRGILTGFNDAFFIDENTRNKLIQEDQKSLEIIKPLIRGRDIKKFKIEFNNIWVIASRRGINIDDYPAIRNHLEKWKSNLIPKPEGWKEKWIGRKSGSYLWYEWQDVIAYYNSFSKPKLVWLSITDKPAFAYDEEGLIVTAPAYIMISKNAKYLLAILNSKVMEWYMEKISSTTGQGTVQWSKVFVEKLPIPMIDDEKQLKLIELVYQISTLKKDNKNVDHLESLLNLMVCKSYNLTYEDAIQINPTLSFTKNEYLDFNHNK